MTASEIRTVLERTALFTDRQKLLKQLWKLDRQRPSKKPADDRARRVA